MAPGPSTSFRSRFGFAKSRRVIALDPGSTCLKLLLAEMRPEGPVVLASRAIDLREEGLISHEEILGQLAMALRELGPYPIALALPQHRAISQLLELADVDPEAVRRAMEAETVKLSGLIETAMAYDFTALRPFGNYKNPFWLTLCREGELRSSIEQLRLTGADLCEVTASANGLIATFQRRPSTRRFGLLVDFGGRHTELVVMVDKQGVFASSFPFGSEAVTQAIASHKECSTDIAELFKRAHNVFAGADQVAGAASVARKWLEEVEKAVRDWAAEHPELGATLTDFEVLMTGGGSRQQGLIAFLNEQAELRFELWQDRLGPDLVDESGHFAVVYGTMLHAFGLASQATSLLPAEFEAAVRRRQTLVTMQAVGFGLLLLTALILAVGTWTKFSLIRRKKELLAQAENAVETARKTETLNRQIVREYQRLQPALELERFTVDTLEALNAIQRVRTNRSLWFVLFADQPTYFTASLRSATNGPATNEIVAVSTNTPLARRGFVAELCIPEDADSARRTLSQVVGELKQDRVFRNVDTLPAEARRPLGDPKLMPADKCFSLSLELAENDFPLTLSAAEKPAPPVGREVRPPPRTFKQRSNGPPGGAEPP